MLLIKILLLPSLCLGANILVYNPMFSHSHSRFLGNIADVLARQGHNVTVFSPIIVKDYKPFGTSETKNIHKIRYDIKTQIDGFEEVQGSIRSVWDSQEVSATKPEDMKSFYIPLLEMYRTLLNDRDLISSLRNAEFDLAIHEFFEFGSTLLMEYIGVKQTIVASAFGEFNYFYELTGLPNMATFVPMWMTSYDNDMTFSERISNIVMNIRYSRTTSWMEDACNKLYKEFDPNIPTGRDVLMNRAGLIFINVNEFCQLPRPTTNMIQHVGGSQVYPAEPLPKELDELLNIRPQNAFFSLGTYQRFCEAPDHVKQLFMESLSAFPNITFIFKYEKCLEDKFDFSKYPNVYPFEWLPQKDLLGDDRINLFITHGGMNSIIEGQIRGKPMITIPVFGDQLGNAKAAARFGSTILVDRRYLTKELMIDSISSILDPKNEYIKRAKIIKKTLDSRPEDYRKKIARWVELQIDNGKPFEHLPLHSRNMSFIALYGLDIFISVLLVSIILLIFSHYIIQKVFSVTFRKNQKTEKLH